VDSFLGIILTQQLYNLSTSLIVYNKLIIKEKPVLSTENPLFNNNKKEYIKDIIKEIEDNHF
jgi:hypothetical protein